MHGWFRFFTSIGLAVDSMKAHKLRTFLTLLGVLIGVLSVVLVGAAIEGLGVTANDITSKAFGTETYLIAQIASPGGLSRRQVFEKLRKNKQIRKEDLAHLRMITGDQILYSPYQQRAEDVKAGERTFEGAIIIGVAAALADIRDVAVADGRFFTDQEEQTRQQVCVIGEDLRVAFFEGTTPIGKSIKVRGYDFRVVGVQEKLGSSFGRTQDNSVYMPAAVYSRLYGYPATMSIFGRPRAGTGLTLDSSLDITRVALRSRFRAKPGADDPFEFLTPDSIRGFVDNILGLISVVVVPVTMISLVVGGIVIMNIMLVSVTERTREIGVRKSLGARSSDILLQFLLESLIVSAAGGMLGLAFAALLCEILSQAFGAALKITTPYVVLAIFVSSATGVISGWYPARRAARLDPVEALRSE
ncbi:MAG: ABC transporter permease [Acidobacteria bacterium]|nr:ABC transporter permease [Acidobacteriota bacterium]